jgi:hypothetical protein
LEVHPVSNRWVPKLTADSGPIPIHVDVTLPLYELDRPEVLGIELPYHWQITLSFFIGTRDYNMPWFARSLEFQLPFYELEPESLTLPRDTWSYSFTIAPVYEVETEFRLPNWGLGYTLGFYELEVETGAEIELGWTVDLPFFTVEGADSIGLMPGWEVTVGLPLYEPELDFSPVQGQVLLPIASTDHFVQSEHTELIYKWRLKVDPFAHAGRKGGRAQGIHSDKVRVQLRSVMGTFILETPVRVPAGSFVYETPNQTLRIENTTDWNLTLTPDDVDTTAIPVTSTPGNHVPILSWGKDPTSLNRGPNGLS